MSNKEYFDWLYERLIHVYNENPNVDFIQSFKKRTDWLIQNTIGWISVKDRLPEKSGYYITCVVEYYKQERVPQCVGVTLFNGTYWEDDDYPEEKELVDYWMPIPELPNKDE